VTSTSRAGLNGRLCRTLETASTRCVVRKAARFRPSARFGSSQHATSATTTSVRPIHARATCGHPREEGLIRTERLDGHRDVAVVLTKEGRDVLESNRHDHSHDHRQDHRHDHRQEFYAGLKKPLEVEHDSQVYRAYLREAERLAERGARIDLVVLDYELKREYQRWLHERDRDRDDADGRPDREPHEIEE